MIGRQIREYKIIEEIGEGGMGKVYLAEHSVLGQVAIKALAPQLCSDKHFRDRFIKEAKAQFALKHGNIVQLHTLMEEGKELFLVLEYIDGYPLDVLLQNEKKLDSDKALDIMKDILDGLNFAHSKGVIHRDIKPSNILITKEGKAKVMDFGIALMSDGKRLTKTGTTLGTAWYMSPEQITKPKDIDHRSDVYSAGIILYELLSGDVPFDGETDFKIYQKHVNETPDVQTIKDNQTPLIVSKILLKALEKNPDDRFSGCGEFMNYIIAYQNENNKKPQPDPDETFQPEDKPENQIEMPYFFPVSIKKMTIMSIFTMNLYLFYWNYKNWKCIKENTGRPIMPFWRAFFSVFFIHSLFKSMKELADKSNIDNELNIGGLSFVYIILLLSTYLPDPYFYIELLRIFTVFPVQRLVNNMNEKLAPQIDKNDSFSGLNILCIVIVTVLYTLIYMATSGMI